jgi:two-component system, NtrC family, sensor kinase
MNPLLEPWQTEIMDSFAVQTASLIGLFTISGVPIYLNSGMRKMFGLGVEPANITGLLQAPKFSSLRFSSEGDRPSYSGRFNFSDLRDNYYSVRGVAYARASQILILAEHDVELLEQTRCELFDLNSEVNDLQRTLAREKKALEHTLAELRHTQAALIQSEKLNSLGQLVAGVAHEINNPIAYVASNIFSLKQQVEDLLSAYQSLETLFRIQAPENAEKAQELREASDLDFLEEDVVDLLAGSLEGLSRVKGIVEDLRDFSRLDEAEQQMFDLNGNIETTLAIASVEAKKQKVTVVKELGPLPPIPGYPAQFNQAVLNLLVNGVQAMQGNETRKRVLTVKTRREAEAVVLEIGDTGSGISAEIRSRIFDPFFTTKPVGMGTGLGLSVVYTVIHERHGGTIEVTSEVGLGSVFTIKLPMESQNA